ncbi:uncharacterized protein G2W53_017842 [Senna tora]|uniref:Uncharacterized protein n=1 Tax=Senna tora TaxID=362788 RepID=A0A834TQ83_9FABA|nr:uncharacterized protein G2W53_017842 [Senna tora]
MVMEGCMESVGMDAFEVCHGSTGVGHGGERFCALKAFLDISVPLLEKKKIPLRSIGNGLHSKIQPRSKPDPPCKLAVFENMLYRFGSITTMRAQISTRNARSQSCVGDSLISLLDTKISMLCKAPGPFISNIELFPKGGRSEASDSVCSSGERIETRHLPKLMKKVTHRLTSIPVCFKEHRMSSAYIR